ncbi:MAG: family oxidoreductase [Chitinophagaceae bacterium]|nr:family oxidoreductase [Chitinophagaceae bacterium]
MKKMLEGQIAIITGASSGIGEACAKKLAEEGATVVVNYATNPDDGNKVVKAIEDKGGRAIAIHADVSKEEDVINMFRRTIDEFGTVDILINNAGIQKDAPLTSLSLEDWNKVISINLTGQFLCAKEAAKEFMRRGVVKEKSVAAGKIICMSSVHEVIPWAGHDNYASSKGGVMMMMKSLAQELAPFKIRVNSIAPGAIQTPINKDAWGTKEALENLLKLIPYGRIGQPEDVGKLAAWLASDESDYITGTTIFIDGGMTLYPGFAGNG